MEIIAFVARGRRGVQPSWVGTSDETQTEDERNDDSDDLACGESGDHDEEPLILCCPALDSLGSAKTTSCLGECGSLDYALKAMNTWHA